MTNDTLPTDEVFQRRLRSAAAAAWWVFLVGYGILLVQYGIYLWVSAARPAGFLALWGPAFDWTDVLRWWMAATIALKLLMWMEALAALWLSLWARMLRSS